MENRDLNRAWVALKWTYGLVPIVAGLDKFTNLVTDWQQYLNPLALRIVPLSATTFMYVVGVVEIAAGVLVLTRLTKLGALVVSAWLVAIALNLVTSGRFLDVAVRDLALSVGAFSLARLTDARAVARAGARRDEHPAAPLVPARAGA
jgi:uncharacterized membrane protein YphA (DoxX/SURF4 family)